MGGMSWWRGLWGRTWQSRMGWDGMDGVCIVTRMYSRVVFVLFCCRFFYSDGFRRLSDMIMI